MLRLILRLVYKSTWLFIGIFLWFDIFFSFLWHFGLLWIQWILFYTTFTDVIERRDFTAIFAPIFQEATVIFNNILPWFSYSPTHAPPVFAGFVFVDPCSRLVNMGQRVPIITHDEIVEYPSNWHQLPIVVVIEAFCTDVPALSALRASSSGDLVVPRTRRRNGCRCTTSMELAADRAEAAAVDHYYSSSTENIFAPICLRTSERLTIVLWCAFGLQ